MQNERVLVLAGGGGIGDVFLATPVMRALRGRYAHVTALVLPAHADVLIPAAADEVWIDTGDVLALRHRFALGRFDAAVVTWATPRVAYALALAGIPIRVGQARRLYSALFTHRVQVRSELGDRLTHWTDIQLDYARALGLDGDPMPIAPMTIEAEAEAERLREREGLRPGSYAILHPTRGISHSRALWPTSRLAELATQLRERYDVTVLI